MRIKMIVCAASDRQVFARDREYDLPDVEAKSMVRAGHAIFVKTQERAPGLSNPATPSNRSKQVKATHVDA